VGALDRTFHMSADVLQQIRHEMQVSGAEAASKLVPDEVLDRFAFAGTPAAVAEHALDVLKAGADRVDFGTPHGASDDHGLELLGRQVLPAIREGRG
jgi:5,10-methylenetetrahydromethanopterin reductase